MQEIYGTTLCVQWLNANGAYVVTFGEQLIPIGGKFLFNYRKDLEDALDKAGLCVRDFEGKGIVFCKDAARFAR